MRVNRSFQATPKQIFGLVILSIVLVVIQNAFFSNLFSGHYVPQLIGIMIMFLAFYWRTLGGLVFCWLLGLLLDFQIAILLGPSMIACLVIFLLFSTIANNLYINSQFVLILSGAVGAIILILVQQLVQSIFIEVGLSNLMALAKDAIATAIVTPFLFLPLNRWFLTSSKI